MEDDAQSVASAPQHAAHAVAHRRAVPAARALHRAVARREDQDLPLLGGDGLAARLGAGPLLHQQEVAPLVVRGPPAQEAGELQREHDVAVDVLVQAVVAARLVVQQQRGGLRLPPPMADRQQPVQIGRMQRRGLQRRLELVGDGRQRRVGVHAQRLHEGGQGIREVLVVADAEPVARHVDPAAKARLVVVGRDQLGALVGGEQGWGPGVSPFPQRALDGRPVERGQARSDIGHGGEYRTPVGAV
jgi:hypothetical protein